MSNDGAHIGQYHLGSLVYTDDVVLSVLHYGLNTLMDALLSSEIFILYLAESHLATFHGCSPNGANLYFANTSVLMLFCCEICC